MRKIIEITLSKFQWNNLQKLHDYLVDNKKKVTPHFNMSVYAETVEGQAIELKHGKMLNKCGTIGCLVGHGPVAGIPAYAKDGDWSFYANRVFGSTVGFDIMVDGILFDWLFSEQWANHERTVRQAINRLAFTLKYKAVPAKHQLN